MLHWYLLTGPLPVVLLVAAALAAVYLLAWRGPGRWLPLVLPCVMGGATVLTLIIAWYVNQVWRPFPDALPAVALIWMGAVLAAVGVATVMLVKARPARRVIAVVALLVIVVTGLNQVNREYGYLPTLADALGQAPPQAVPLPPDRTAQVAAGHKLIRHGVRDRAAWSPRSPFPEPCPGSPPGRPGSTCRPPIWTAPDRSCRC